MPVVVSSGKSIEHSGVEKQRHYFLLGALLRGRGPEECGRTSAQKHFLGALGHVVMAASLPGMALTGSRILHHLQMKFLAPAPGLQHIESPRVSPEFLHQ